MSDTGTARRPVVVAYGDDALAVAAAELEGAGWRLVDAAVPHPDDPAACPLRVVRTRADAESVVLAALRGEALVARVDIGGDDAAPGVVADMIEDLTALGPVVQVHAATAVRLDAVTWRLLHAIAAGTTLDTAARRSHVSSRTASRRLTEARQALGAGSRAQLVRVLASPQRIPPAR